jgi:hypothetical protein
MKDKKYVSHKSVMRSLKKTLEGKGKPRKVVNDELKSSLIKILDKEIIEDSRSEALKLLLKANQEEIGQFLYYYHSQSVVMPCVIDTIKDRLVAEGKMKLKKSDKFGLLCRPEFNDK